MQRCSFGFLEKQEQTPSTVKTAIFSKNVSKLSKLVEMLKIFTRCKYGENLYQTITSGLTFAYQYTYLANICPHFSRQRKSNANLELQIYHIFAPFANISKSV